MSEIDELKHEIAELKEMAEETNRGVRKMRRSQRLHTIFTILWWLTIVGVSGYAYITYVQPYVDKAIETYGNAQDLQLRVEDFFAQFGRNNTQ